MTAESRRKPRDAEEAAAFKGMGQAITAIRERRGMDREELAAKCEMTPAELEKIEEGEIDEWWGGVRLIAKALDMPLGALMIEAEESAPGPGGEAWRQNTREAEGDNAILGAWSDADGATQPETSDDATEQHERQLWEELNSLLTDAVPDGANEKQAEDAILFAIMGSDTEIHDLYERVRRLARDRPGYLRERLEEPGPVARVRRRLYGRWA
jgi:transcriptional regulator with XRE-family HTH domain